MYITVNGQPYEVSDDFGLLDLIQLLKIGEQRFAIEINEEVVSRSEYKVCSLHEGDRVEIVQAIGGG